MFGVRSSRSEVHTGDGDWGGSFGCDSVALLFAIAGIGYKSFLPVLS